MNEIQFNKVKDIFNLEYIKIRNKFDIYKNELDNDNDNDDFDYRSRIRTCHDI